MSLIANDLRWRRPWVCLCALLSFLAAACGGPTGLTVVQGDPPEVREMLRDAGYGVDDRPASLRTADAFFQALKDGDGGHLWSLLDLRAEAAWQSLQDQRLRSEAGPGTIVGLVRPLFPRQLPRSLERTAWDPVARTARVRAGWGSGPPRDLDMVLSANGWRVLVAPPGVALPSLPRDDRPTETTPPIRRDEETQPVRQPRRGGGNPFTNRGF